MSFVIVTAEIMKNLQLRLCDIMQCSTNIHTFVGNLLRRTSGF